MNYSGFFGESPNHDEIKNKKERLLNPANSIKNEYD